MRISPDHQLADIKARIDEIVSKRQGVTWEFIQSFDKPAVSSVQDNDPNWSAIVKAFSDW